MKTAIRHIIFISIVFGLGLAVGLGIFMPQQAFADEAGDESASEAVVEAVAEPIMDTDEAVLFELINSARRDPLGTAESLGMDRNEILNDFPEYEDILINGMPELKFDNRLYQASGEHTSDMLANNYYAYESLDGRTPAQRMNDAGYVATVSGESLGFIFFNNFIDSEKAAKQIFANMYKDELDPEWSGQRNILNPDIVDMGVSIKGGVYQFNSRFSGNVYMSTCDFATEVENYELELLQLINQARANSRAVAQYYGIDTEAALNAMPELESLFSSKEGLPPLAFNAHLYSAAQDHILDMFENGYYARNSLDGRTPGIRFRENGYEPVWAGESIGRLSTCYTQKSPAEAVARIFEQMVLNAFRLQGWRDQNMFSEDAMETGIRVIAGESEALSGICGDNIHLSVVDYGAPRFYAGPAVTGMVYCDLNENSLFDVGEGIPGVVVTIKKVAIEKSDTAVAVSDIAANPAGGFSTDLSPGRYRISISTDLINDTQAQWITIGEDDANKWVIFKIQPDDLVSDEIVASDATEGLTNL